MRRRELEWSSRSIWAPISVKENMSKDVASVTAETCVAEIARRLRDEMIGCVPVTDGGKVVGIITDRDITCRVTAAGLDPVTTTAKAIMTTNVSVCFEDDLLGDAAKIMGDRRVRRLPVLDRNEELVGLLTADDLAWHTDSLLIGRVIGTVSEPHQ